MPETREPRSVVDAAERAAAAGDYASAEHLLREAALLQEASLGPLHPDLANTLNNLGVVCEIMDKPSDAERCFRRACAIATAALEPNHPFVATSRKNLEDFCAARGKAPDRPPYEEPRPAASRRWIHPSVLGAVVAALLVLALIATVTLFRSNDDVGSSPRGPGASPETPATRAKSPPAVPIGPHAPPNPPASSRPTASAPQPHCLPRPATGAALQLAFQLVRARSSTTRDSGLRRIRRFNIDGIAAIACTRWWSFIFGPTPQAATARTAAPPLTIRTRATGRSSSEAGTRSCCTRSASSSAECLRVRFAGMDLG
jgi:Tetratricopeptide repeat